MRRNTKIFFFIYFFFIFLLLFSVVRDLRLQLLFFGGSPSLLFFLNGFQRVFGVLALFLLFVQIVFGAYRPYLSKKMGSWVMSFHIWQGRLIYLFIFIHTFSLLTFNFFAKKGFDPFYVFVDFCLLCPTRQELFYSFGRIAFWLLNITVVTALLRNTSWWRENWRYFHLLNYPLFFLVSSHAFFVGSDFSLKVGFLGRLNLMLAILVFLIVLQKFIAWFKSSFRWK